MSRLWGIPTTIAFLVMVGCSSEVGPRGQLVVVLDTDVPVVDQILARPDLSNDAAMDSVRVDVLDAKDNPVDLLDVTVPDPLDWPLSFGVATGDATSVRLRVRLFRAQHAVPGVLNGIQTLEPDAAVTIDRVVDVALPTAGITTLEVFLAGDCLGVIPSFATPAHNCIDGAHTTALSSDGVVTLAELPTTSRIGTWPPAIEVPCSTPGDATRICIRGGFSLLGDSGLTGVADGIAIRVDSAPLRPVLVSPFYLDETEVTVGAFDQLLASNPSAIAGPLPIAEDAANQQCSWLGGKPGNETLPINCISHKTALQYCVARNGTLPSEAQWEHAARGRGQHRRYPWGLTDPSCCIASIDRVAGYCTPFGIEPVGSHKVGMGCGGIGDVSRDGVLDLGGSLREHTRDTLAEYTILVGQAPECFPNPVCTTGAPTAFISRGASFQAPFWGALSALRQTDLNLDTLPDTGFRCAYSNGGS